MENRAIHIKSFGCQMNKLDTGLVASALQDAGFRLTESVKEADAVIINTCSVRQHAEDRVLSNLGHLKHLRQHRPGLVVAVIGCMAQRLGDTLLEHDAVDIVCGPAQIPQLAELISQALARHEKHLAVTETIRRPVEGGDGVLDDFESAYSISDQQIPGQAFVRVMRGCNYFCTYCVVPYVRGPEACRSPQVDPFAGPKACRHRSPADHLPGPDGELVQVRQWGEDLQPGGSAGDGDGGARRSSGSGS